MILSQESSPNDHNESGATLPVHQITIPSSPSTPIIPTPPLDTSCNTELYSTQPLSTPSDSALPSARTRRSTPSPSSTPSHPNFNNNMVHREPESPTLPSHRGNKVDESSSSDEAFLKQNLQFKLGSVTPSSNDDIGDFRNRSTEKSEDPDAEQVLRAVQVLNGLASMGSSDYQTALVDKNNPLSTNPDIQNLLATNPPLVKLHQSIHRFHSQIRNLTAENDQQTVDLLHLQSTLEAKNERMAQLEAAVAKLHKRNTKLKARTKSSQSKTRKLFQQVQDFTANATKRKKEEDFAKLAMQVQCHEQIMMNRERTDSNFSDLDGLQDFLPETTSMASSADLDTVSSTQSSVYEDGVATLRISRERTATWPHPLGGGDSRDEDVLRNELEEQSPSKKQVDLEHLDEELRRKRPVKQHNPNPFAMLLGPRPAQPYTLQFEERFQLQFVALLVPSDRNQISTNNESKKDQTTDSTAMAFAICGYHGFDSSLNVKPTAGARLLQINRQDMDPAWTVQDLEQHIRGLGPRATMTFRNDTWSSSQKEALQMAIQEQERLHPESASAASTPTTPMMINPFARKRSESSDNAAPSPANKTPSNKSNNNKNLWGFLNFQGNGNAETKKASGAPNSIMEGSHEQIGDSIESPDTSNINRTRSEDSRDSQTSRGNLSKNVMPKLWRKRGPGAESAKMAEIAPTTECFSFEEEDPPSSLFVAAPQDKPTSASKSDEKKQIDAVQQERVAVVLEAD